MSQELLVGLVVLTDIPGMGCVAILQRRGEFNHETMAPETWPGAFQLTAHGGAEHGETATDAIMREVREELGKDAADILSCHMAEIREIGRYEKTDKLVVQFAIWLSSDFIRHIRLEPSSGGLRLIHESDLPAIANLLYFDKKTGVPLRERTAMFPDGKEALQKAFRIFRPAVL